MHDSSIGHVSDTAVWVAMYRALETEKAKPAFRDPFARRLAGPRGEAIYARMRNQQKHEWAYTARTWLFDAFIQERIAAGVDTVVNLAAGLDARPYRMDLPPTLRWIEVDFPEMLTYKASILGSETPRCRVERAAADLADVAARRQLFDRIASEARQALILSEGLLIYLGADGAQGLAEDLAARPPFRWWAFDIASPGLLRMLQKEVGSALDNAPLIFAPPEGPWFFERTGWTVRDVRGSLKWGARITRLPLLLRLFAKLPEKLPATNQPWGGVCLLENAGR